MPAQITQPEVPYSQLSEDDRKLLDQLIEGLIDGAKIPSAKRLPRDRAREHIINLREMGLLRLWRENDRVGWEIYTGKGYKRV